MLNDLAVITMITITVKIATNINISITTSINIIINNWIRSDRIPQPFTKNSERCTWMAV